MQDPVYSRIENEPRPTLFASSAFVLLACLGLWVASLVQMALPARGLGVSQAVYYLGFVALPLALYMKKHPGLSPALRLNPLPLLPTLSVLLLAFLSVFAAGMLTSSWSAALDALGLKSPATYALPDSSRALVPAVITMAAMPAVFEELLFRGFVLSAWESRGTRFAIWISAGLFALLHGNLYGLPAYLLVGAVSGLIVFSLDSLYGGMVYHTAYNAACLALPLLITGGEVPADAAGGSTLTLLLDALMVGLLMAMSLSSLRLRAGRVGIQPIPRIRRPLSGRERIMLAAAVCAMLFTVLIVQALTLVEGGAA
ncbi:MAG: CPBP family intramembrane metalloprotease [Clostridia bacterium]|nr:CPBP family intramembrane metalloprotease [Clostridia bacterium]